ncbi:glycoside hydrolase family 18 protein [Pedobacter punctiformis]|uniref:chitinase n=1 Tax=Pedobacter punctiformis TaxID=3004097 RepID=A0ABT4L7T1_9SPHI|nr:glycoside hydrolase family 18 protein [Pedobacter sp. HCMS5-2]MCZ4243983.1 glycoside hydrolase family 18 protein [Pedobacter sp. HCMS5-2]
MMKVFKSYFIVVALIAFTLMAMRSEKLPKKKVVIGYVGGYKGLADVTKIAAEKLTHINYAFVNVKGNRAFLNREATDTVNLRNLNKLKLKNPDLKILISIGGWAWSENFSDAALTDTSRKAFAASAVKIIEKYNLDGVDIDWEYPAIAGEQGNVFRPEDKQNFTFMLKELRLELDSLEQLHKAKKMLTIAVGGFTNFIRHSEMDKVHQYLDYVNLMTYDFYNVDFAGHHTNLYNSKKYPAENYADKTFREFLAAGVPANKLVMGIAFYSRSFTLKENSIKGLGDSVLSSRYGKGYTFIKDSLINQKGFTAYHDKEAVASYIYNPATREYMTYDDEKSVKEKCKYVLKNNMGGVMFWEYDSDLNGYLLNQINKTLK